MNRSPRISFKNLKNIANIFPLFGYLPNFFKNYSCYNLFANVLMLRNVVDITDVLNKMAIEDEAIIPEMVKRLSPYMRFRL